MNLQLRHLREGTMASLREEVSLESLEAFRVSRLQNVRSTTRKHGNLQAPTRDRDQAPCQHQLEGLNSTQHLRSRT